MNTFLQRCVIVLSSLLLFNLVRATDHLGHDCQQCESPIFIPRPQNLNSAALYNPYYYPCCKADLEHWLNISLAYRYEQTRHGSRIAECLFGSDTLNFAGSQQTKREAGKQYVLAENFGLSPSFLGSINFNPRIKNNIIDCSMRFELGHWTECFDKTYIAFNASLVHTDWNLNACEKTLNDPSNPDSFIVPQCLHSNQQEPALRSIFDALSGQYYFGQLEKGPMPYGRFVLNRSQTKTALANIDMIVGYDLYRCDGYHCGLFMKAVAPTGNRPNPATVFSPIIGNGHHWELGGGLDAHYDLWCCDNASLTVALTGAITHLFSDQQTRTFNIIKNEPCCLSQYSLLKEYSTTVDTDGKIKYFDVNKLAWGTTFSTLDVHSSFAMQGDAALQIMYRNCGWAFSFGYNVYGRSSEKITQLEGQCDRTNRNFGLKGKTGVCGLQTGTTNLCEFTTPQTTTGLQATDSTDCLSNSNTEPAVIDQPATIVAECRTWDNEIVQNTNTPGILTTDKDLNFSGAPTQISHKIFGHINYQWQECENQPFVGLGAECEFAQDGSCNVCTASQWGAWIKGGLYF